MCCQKPNDELVLETYNSKQENTQGIEVEDVRDKYPHDSDPAFKRKRYEDAKQTLGTEVNQNGEEQMFQNQNGEDQMFQNQNGEEQMFQNQNGEEQMFPNQNEEEQINQNQNDEDINDFKIE